MSALTYEQLTLRDSGDSLAFMRSLWRAIRDVPDHWWCSLPAVMEELLPMMLRNQEMLDRCDMQLQHCRNCARQYHNSLESWRSKTNLNPDEADSVVSNWRQIDADRILPRLASAVCRYRNSRELLNGSALGEEDVESHRRVCEDLLFELLADARLTMRTDVANGVGDMFAVLNPISDERIEENFVLNDDGMCLPGIYVLCFHEFEAVRGWAQRCLRKYSCSDLELEEVQMGAANVEMPPGTYALFDYCTGRVEDELGSPYIDLTSDHEVEEVAKFEMFACSLPVFWEGFAALVVHFASVKHLECILDRHSSCITPLVYSIGEGHPFIVKNAARVLAHLLRVLRYRVWLKDPGLPISTVVETVIQAYHFQTADDEVKKCLLEFFPPLVRSLSHTPPAVCREVLGKATAFLFDVCAAPRHGHGASFFRGSSSAINHRDQPAQSFAYKTARVKTAEVILGCHSMFPRWSTFVDENRVGELLELMLVECSTPHPSTLRLLRTILVSDAANIVRAFTSPAIESLASAARPQHLKSISFSRQPESKDVSQLALGDEFPSNDANGEERRLDEGASGEEDNFMSCSQREDQEDENDAFDWCQTIWQRLLRGRFRVLSLGATNSKKSWPECVALLDVHALIGMLEVPVGDLSITEAQERVDLLSSALRVDGRVDPELRKAKLALAYVTAMEAIQHQLRRGLRPSAEGKQREPWLQMVPQAAGHLMASTVKAVRHLTFQLLTKLSKPNVVTSAGEGANFGANTLVVRFLLSDVEYGTAVMRGTGHAARLLSVYGPTFSFQCYLHMVRWIHQLLTCQESVAIDFLRDKVQEQVSCMVEQFVLNWQSHSDIALFSEAMSRFLKELRAIWKWLVSAETEGRAKKKHCDLLDVLLCLKSCRDASVRANWVELVHVVVTQNGHTSHQCEVIADLLSCSEFSPSEFLAAQCAKLVDAFGLPPVAFPAEGQMRHSKTAERLPVNTALPGHEKIPVPRSTGVSGNYALSSEDVAKLARPIILKRSHQQRLPESKSNSLVYRSEDARLQAVSAKLNLAPRSTEQVYSDEMISIQHASRLRQGRALRVKGVPAALRRRKHVKKGPSKMELVVAAAKEAERRDREERASHGLGTGKRALALEELPSRKSRRASAAPSVPVSLGPQTAQRHRPDPKKMRRILKPRRLDDFYSRLLCRDIDSILSDGSSQALNRKQPEAANFWETSEAYVSHFEALLAEELYAQVRHALEYEAQVARESPPQYDNATTEWACRTPFEVAVPPTTHRAGNFREIVLRFCGSGLLRDSSRMHSQGVRSVFDDISASRLCPGDLVRMQMTKYGRGHAQGHHGSSGFADLLGLVAAVQHRGPATNVTIVLRFPSTLSEPGPQRAFTVSKLCSLTPVIRQWEALWTVNKLSDSMLHMLLDPKSYWKMMRRGVDTSPSLPGDDSDQSIHPARQKVVSLMRARGLNPSQLRVVETAARLTSGRQEAPAEPGRASTARDAFTLLQGPPGTGKSSTVLSILSVLLAPYAQRVEPVERQTGVAAEGQKDTRENWVAPFRILVCAPSNAAVDELMVRIADKGVLNPSGDMFCPKMIRVGTGSKDDRLTGFHISEVIRKGKSGKASGEGPSGSDSAEAFTRNANSERERQRQLLRETSAMIGEKHNEREAARKVHDGWMATSISSSHDNERKKRQEMFIVQDKRLTDSLSNLHDQKQQISRSLASADKLVRNAAMKRDEEEMQLLTKIVNGAEIVFATLNAAGHDVLRYNKRPFDVVVIDEAAQSVEPDILIPLIGANRSLSSTVSRCIMVGDPKQLPATVLCNNVEVVKGLSSSLFERLQNTKRSIVHLLKVQYRMHPAISRFPSDHFYGGRLKNGSCVKSTQYRKPYHYDRAARFGPVSFFDTSKSRLAAEQRSKSGSSIANLGEAQIVCALLSSLFRLYPTELCGADKVAVLTPYKQQVNVIRKEIEASPFLKEGWIEVGTVDGIQGREKEIVVLSTVRGGGSSGIGFVKDRRRMNVALTRAQNALIVVGNAKSLAAGSEDWSALVTHCRDNGRVHEVMSPREAFPEAYVSQRNLPAAATVPSDATSSQQVGLEVQGDAISSDDDMSDMNCGSQSDFADTDSERDCNSVGPKVSSRPPSPAFGNSPLGTKTSFEAAMPLGSAQRLDPHPVNRANKASGRSSEVQPSAVRTVFKCTVPKTQIQNNVESPRRALVSDGAGNHAGVEPREVPKTSITPLQSVMTPRSHGLGAASRVSHVTTMRNGGEIQKRPVFERPATNRPPQTHPTRFFRENGKPGSVVDDARGSGAKRPLPNRPPELPPKRVRAGTGRLAGHDAARLSGLKSVLAAKTSSGARPSVPQVRKPSVRSLPAAQSPYLAVTSQTGSSVASLSRPQQSGFRANAEDFQPVQRPSQRRNCNVPESHATAIEAGSRPGAPAGTSRNPVARRKPSAPMVRPSGGSRTNSGIQNRQGREAPPPAFNLLGASKAMEKTVSAKRRSVGDRSAESKK